MQNKADYLIATRELIKQALNDVFGMTLTSSNTFREIANKITELANKYPSGE